METEDNNLFRKIIFEICKEQDIECKVFSNGWVMMLKKNDITRFITGYKFDSNRHAMGLIFDDKFAMYEYLKTNNIPVIEHRIIYKEDNANDYAHGAKGIEYLEKLFEEFNHNIVLKTNRGSCGVGVHHISDGNLLESTFLELINNRHSLSVCPFYNIVYEYRVIVVDGQIELMYKKINPKVVGDGVSTIKELLMKFNYNYFKDYDDDNKDTVLNNGEIFEYGWKFNLSRGSISSLDIEEIDKLKIIDLVNKINNICKIDFASVDIIKSSNDEIMVMEINSGVMTNNFISQHEDGYEIAKNIYKKAIIHMFE